MEGDFFIDDRCMDFLLLAEGEFDSRAYAFKYKGKIIYLEDIPENYPSIHIFEVTEERLKQTEKELQENGWLIRITRINDIQ